MNHIQGTFIAGYVTIVVKGQLPELFFQSCARAGIPVWDVKKIAADRCQGNIKLQDVKKIKQLRRGKNLKIKFIAQKGYPFIWKRLCERKPILFSLLLSIALIMFLSNIIWKVQITGVPKDLEQKINKELTNYGIHSGTFTFTLDSPSAIQQKLLNDVPELLWIGVYKKGTTFFLEGVEKTLVEKQEVKGPRHLLANKKGVIKKIYVSKGVPKVKVNDYVEVGDMLVSGKINVDEEEFEEDDADQEEKPVKIVAAEAVITANTWYELAVTIPLNNTYERLTGNQEKKYALKLGAFPLPIWGYGKPDYKEIYEEHEESNLNFFKWQLPIKINTITLSEMEYIKEKRTEEEAKAHGILQAKETLKLQLGPEAKILTEKILHETIDNGKVRLNLYMTVEEDITKAQPIHTSSKK